MSWERVPSIGAYGGAHYSVFRLQDQEAGVDALREFFVSGPDEMNLVLFSTSGVHGCYTTIEDIERSGQAWGWEPWTGDDDPPKDWPGRDEGRDWSLLLTFTIFQPRIVCARYGRVRVRSQAEVDYLRSLRDASAKVAASIGVGS